MVGLEPCDRSHSSSLTKHIRELYEPEKLVEIFRAIFDVAKIQMAIAMYEESADLVDFHRVFESPELWTWQDYTQTMFEWLYLAIYLDRIKGRHPSK